MSHASNIHRFAIALACALTPAAGPAFAQDSFVRPAGPAAPATGAAAQPQYVEHGMPPPTGYEDDAPLRWEEVLARLVPPDELPQANAGAPEAQDFGVPATGQLRPTQQLHGPTPTSIPGGRVIATQELAQLLQGGQQVLLLDVLGGPLHIPGAVPVVPAAQGGGFDDEVQRGFGQYLAQVTGVDTSRLLVTYCGGVQCWSSYNAALRAMKLGYRNVVWYRGGIEAWQHAGLPLQGAGGPGPQPQQPTAAQRQR